MVEREPFIDLVHRELDNELTADETEFLHRLLAQDPARQEFRERLHHLHNALDQVPDIEPPAMLRSRVLEAVPFARPQTSGRSGRATMRRKSVVVYPLAAGFLGLAILVGWWLGLGSTGSSLEPAATSATMGLSLDGGHLLNEAGTSLDALKAHASLYRTHGHYTLLLELDARETVDVSVSCVPVDCTVRGFSWLEGGSAEARFVAGRITTPVTGRAGLATQFSDSGRHWTVEFTASGVSLGRLFLTAEPGPTEIDDRTR
jgi:hypothetical protein